jgi:wyosine [tRNA(Phe)-imidazoG37] synthetase (radical SAM superfamily)
VKDLNDGTGAMRDVAKFLARLSPARAYLAVPTRPPAEEWVQMPDEAVVNRAYQILREELLHVEYLIGYEGSEFASTRDVEVDLLAITAVHPMREDAVQEFLTRGGADWSLVGSLLAKRRLVMTSYEGHTFYMRRLPQPGARHSAA